MIAKTVKKLTAKDKAVLSQVKRCGFVSLDLDGKPALEIDFEVTPYRFKRLLVLGYLAPTGDALFDGPSQTYSLTEAGHGA